VLNKLKHEGATMRSTGALGSSVVGDVVWKAANRWWDWGLFVVIVASTLVVSESYFHSAIAQPRRLPRVVHSETTFRGCFASGPRLFNDDEDFDSLIKMERQLGIPDVIPQLIAAGWKAENIKTLPQATRSDIETCINKAKEDSSDGDEFIFFFVGHGDKGKILLRKAESSPIPDEVPARYKPEDEDPITSGKLADMLSGFKKSVTIVVILISCESHTFFSETEKSLRDVTQKDETGRDVSAKSHLALIAATTERNPQGQATPALRSLTTGLNRDTSGFLLADNNPKDGVVTAKELADKAGLYTLGQSPIGPTLCAGAECAVCSDQGEFSYFGPEADEDADLSIIKVDSPDPVGVGGEITYRLRVRNLGPSDATGVIVTDTLPANVNFVSASSGCSRSGRTVTCNIGNMRDGETAVRLIRIRPTTPGKVTNTATVRANEPDGRSGNNTATTVTTVK
jgi:uncharacterized repeat protein (TIGR01451 family)